MARRNERIERDDDFWDEEPLPKKGGGIGTFLVIALLVAAICVFCYSGYRLFNYYKAYKAGEDEYNALNDEYIAIQADSSDQAQTDFAFDEGENGARAQSLVLTDVTSLEDPDTLDSIIDSAYKEEVSAELVGELAGEQASQTQGSSLSGGDLDNVAESGRSETGAQGETSGGATGIMLPVLVNPVNFAELNAVNAEIIGWIRVGAVGISYPVAQADDNDYYLHRTFKKVDNFAGCIFENCENSPYFTDQNTIIYGHNMKNGTMFGKLSEFSEQDTYDKNPYFWIFTDTFIYQYQIFSSSVVNKMGDPYITRFATVDYQEFIDKMISSSEINCGNVSVRTNDKIVTLSTCTGDDSTRRIVQGVLIQRYIAK